MSVVNQGNVIKIIGGNFTFNVFMMVYMLILFPAAIILFLVILMGGESALIKVFFFLFVMVLARATFLIVRITLGSRKACTIINRVEHSVIVDRGTEKYIYVAGSFNLLVIQLVGRSKGSHYQAYLLGASGKCPLGIQSLTRGRLLRILRPVSQILDVPLECAEQGIGLSDAIAINKSGVKL